MRAFVFFSAHKQLSIRVIFSVFIAQLLPTPPIFLVTPMPFPCTVIALTNKFLQKHLIMAKDTHTETLPQKPPLKRPLPLIILLIIMGCVYASGIYKEISLSSFHAHKAQLQEFAKMAPVLAPIIYIGIYTIFVSLSLPAATILTLTGGFLFGPWLGTLYVVSGATIGATILFMIARSALGATMRDKAGALYHRIEHNMQENAVGYLLFMRLVPFFPFVLVNIVPALFNISLRIYIITTFLGIIPGSFVYVYLGGQLAHINSLSDLISEQTLFAFGLLGVFSLLPTLIKQIKTRISKRTDNKPHQTLPQKPTKDK